MSTSTVNYRRQKVWENMLVGKDIGCEDCVATTASMGCVKHPQKMTFTAEWPLLIPSPYSKKK